MATNVYANDNEIACKAATGKSRAFPDVCHTPPPAAPGPKPPGVPTAYPNTCYASDLTNGSHSVFIKGQEIALERKSYFSRSTGDELATEGLLRGVVSLQIKGRCYFQNWSPNVKVESYCVDRHLDLVTHNHLNPGNTGLFPYLSRDSDREVCANMEKRINEACAEPPEDKSASPGKRRKKYGKKRSNDSDTPKAYNRNWRSDHCDLLNFKAGTLTQEQCKQFLEQAQNAREQIDEARQLLTNLLSDHGQALLTEGGKALVEQAVWGRVRNALFVGGGAVIGGAVGAVGGFFLGGVGAVPGAAAGATYGAGLGTAAAGIDTAINVYDMAILAMDGKALYELFEKQIEAMATTLDELDPLKRYTKPDGSIDAEHANRFLGDLQDAMATINDCTRARKCNLVPKSTAVDYTNPGVGSETAGGRGCCNGQTGHHLLSDAMIKHSGCASYDYARAPTVCVEGSNQYVGSHKRIHKALAAELKKKKDAGLAAADNTISLEDGIDAAVKSHMRAFIASGCDPRCIRKQLQAYYEQIGCAETARVALVGDNGQRTRKGSNQ